MKSAKKTVMKSIVFSTLCILLSIVVPVISDSPESETVRTESDPSNRSWVETTLAGLTLREKIGQLIQVRARGEFLNRKSPEFRSLKDEIDRNHVGGIVLFAGNIYESAVLLNELQAHSNLPLLVSADFERGAAFRIADTTSFPWTMAVGATGSEEFAYQQGLITAREARAMGVHWLFAPVMDVNNNPDNPVINIRSYGEDPELVSRLGSAFIRGAGQGGAMTTAKHFPGHGNTSTDSHIGLAVVPSDMDKLNSVELIPFKRAVAAGVDSIMTAHVAVPKVTGESEVPATLSPEILSGLLRHELGFNGLIVTDAMEMGGITNRYWCGFAAVEAIKAGADVILLPMDTNVAINEIERAVEMGDISPERIDASVKKILNAKSKLELHKRRMVSIDRLSETIESPESLALAQKIADESITAIKDKDGLLPVNPAENPKVYSLVLDSGLAASPGLVFRSEMRTLFPSMISEWVNSRITDEQIDRIPRQASAADLIVCSTIARLSSGRDISAIPEDQRKIIRNLMKTGKPVIWIAFGNPYVLEHFPKIETYICTFSDSDVSQRAAAKAVSGAIPIKGKMPISVPGHASVGTGLEIPKLEMILKSSVDPVFVTSEITLSNSKQTFINTKKYFYKYFESGGFRDARLIVGHQGSIILNFLTGGRRTIMDPVSWNTSDHFAAVIAAMLATESGRLILNSPVKDYLPEFLDNDLGNMTVAELMADMDGKSRTADNREQSNLSLFHEILFRAYGFPVPMILQRQMFEPLDISPTLHINRNSNSAADLYEPADLAVAAQLFLNNGIYNHQRILKPETIARFTSPWSTEKAIGWMKPSKKDGTGRLFSRKAFGYMNTKGRFLWIDPEKELFIILLGEPDPGKKKKVKEDAVLEAYGNITQSILDSIKEK